MARRCLIAADRRNAELHSGAAVFEALDNSKWLPSTYEVIGVLLKHLKRDFADFLGANHAAFAIRMLGDRRQTLKKEVHEKIAAAKKSFAQLEEDRRTELAEKAASVVGLWAKGNWLRRSCTCPSCELTAGMSGETVGRTPARINEDDGIIEREVRVLPNALMCPSCKLELKGFQEMNEAGLGTVYTITEGEDPIEFFGIVPEEHVDIDEMIRQFGEDLAADYQSDAKASDPLN
jgi:hypothetical protein